VAWPDNRAINPREEDAMARKVYITAKVKLIVDADDEVEMADVMGDLDVAIASQTEGAEVLEALVDQYEVTDSK
jgi:hypothetical protein